MVRPMSPNYPGKLITSTMLLLLMISSFASAQTKPSYVVIGYVPAWRDRIADPATFNYAAFTHLNRSFLRPQDDGSLVQEPGFFSESFEQGARKHGVKLLMSIGGESQNPKRWLSIASNPDHLQKFLDSIADLYRDHQYDGVDIDWEPPPQTDAHGQLYLSLLKAVRQRFPDKLLTVALSPNEYGVRHLPLKDVIDTIDYFNAMTYDYSGPWTGIATFAANLYPDTAGANTRISMSEALTHLIEKHQVPASKIVAGLTFWGYRFRVNQLGDTFTKNSKGVADNIEYARVMDLFSTGLYTLHHDAIADASYLMRNDGGCVVTFDDPQSIRDKCAFAKKLGCAGVMMWHAGADYASGTSPLLDAVAQEFGLPTSMSQQAMVEETTLLNHAPLPSTEPADVQTLNDQLRAARGLSDDAHWMATTMPTTTATAMPRATTQP